MRQHTSKKNLVHFSKMHGLGNDFMVVDAVTQNIFFAPEQIKQLALRQYGIGFDQLLLVEPPYDPELDFHYRIFNADGGEVTQCGNGARCFARFVANKGLTNKTTIRVSTFAGKLTLKIERDGKVTVNLGVPNWIPKAIPFKAKKQEKTYILRAGEETIFCNVVSLGNPHCIVQVDDIQQAPVKQLGELISAHERFPEQVNVGFMQIVQSDFIRLRVYERGVGETQACGSGAAAAVAVGQMLGQLRKKVKVKLLGGYLNISTHEASHEVSISGPVQHIFDGQIYC